MVFLFFGVLKQQTIGYLTEKSYSTLQYWIKHFRYFICLIACYLNIYNKSSEANIILFTLLYSLDIFSYPANTLYIYFKGPFLALL